MGLPQAGGLQLFAAAVALQLTLPAQSGQRGPSFREGPHCPQRQGPWRLEPEPGRGQRVAQQRPQVGQAGSPGAGLAGAAAAVGAFAGSAAAGPSSPRTSAAPCGRLVCRPGAAASDTPAARANEERLLGFRRPQRRTPCPLLCLLTNPDSRSASSPRQISPLCLASSVLPCPPLSNSPHQVFWLPAGFSLQWT